MMSRVSFGLRRMVVGVVGLACAVAATGREIIPFNGDWRFALQPAGSGFERPAFDDSAWGRLALPHSWNAVDGEDGGGDYVRGDGWYRKTFPTDPQWQRQRVYLEFGGASRVAEVWLNGARIGEHRGAYARFRFDVTDHLVRDGRNVLAVRVNNEPNGIIPLGGDFTMWGGLHRDVRLLVLPPTHVAVNDHGSSGVYLTTESATADAAVIRARTLIEASSADDRGGLVVTVFDAANAIVATAAAPWVVEAGKTSAVEVKLRISKPHLWNGRADPYLYHVRVELSSIGGGRDSLEQPLGVRRITVDPEHGLFLNGTHVAAHGVNLHQDRIDQGLAATPAQHREDFALLQELGATVVRLCHYQHDDVVYQLADTSGLLVWAEVAFVGPPPTTPEGLDNAAEQLRELIRQNFNHPSIFCWSVGNETGTHADALIERLAAIVKQEDPSRFSTYASHHSPEDPRNFRTDLLGYNRYYGWYSGSYDEFGRWLDEWHAAHPQRPLGISEYGAGASIYQHEQNPPIRAKTQSHGPWHPEEWQNDYHEHAWLQLRDRPYLWGTFIWNLFDFGVDSRSEGDTRGRNDKGLVTYDRLTRKDAFYWYKANWTDAPFVYVTSRRDSLRTEAKTTVKVYSNCEAVELWLNGVSQGRRSSPDRRFQWQDVELKPGPNRVFVVGSKGDRQVTDSCGWTLTSGTPYRPPEDPPAKEAPSSK